eukprot:2965204-Rhodomonas_salina.1
MSDADFTPLTGSLSPFSARDITCDPQALTCDCAETGTWKRSELDLTASKVRTPLPAYGTCLRAHYAVPGTDAVDAATSIFSWSSRRIGAVPASLPPAVPCSSSM